MAPDHPDKAQDDTKGANDARYGVLVDVVDVEVAQEHHRQGDEHAGAGHRK